MWKNRESGSNTGESIESPLPLHSWEKALQNRLHPECTRVFIVPSGPGGVRGAVAAIACLLSISGALAADTSQNANAAVVPPIKAQKPMKMDEPMPGEMKKEGMMKGDVKAAAAKKQRDMKDVMEQEEKAMARETPKGLK